MVNEMEENLYHTHITANRGWLDFNIKEVWKYRDLIVLFTKRMGNCVKIDLSCLHILVRSFMD